MIYDILFLLAKIFGHDLTVVHGLMQLVIDAMADIENLIVCRSADKLRKVVFNQDAHKACVNGLEEPTCIMKSLENVVTAGFPEQGQGGSRQIWSHEAILVNCAWTQPSVPPVG